VFSRDCSRKSSSSSYTKNANIRTVRGLKNKRPSEIFAAITRWMEAGAVKREERGLYERVQQSQARRLKKAA
jgi:hypothetical protein